MMLLLHSCPVAMGITGTKLNLSTFCHCGRRTLEALYLGVYSINGTGIKGLIMCHLYLTIYRHLMVSEEERNIFFSGVATGKEPMFL